MATKVRHGRKITLTVLVGLLLLGAVAGVGAAQELEFWSIGFNPVLTQWLQNEAFPEYERLTGVRIIHTNLGWDDAEERVFVAGSAGVGPDVLATQGDLGITWGRLGFMSPINRYLDLWEDADALVPGLIRPDEETGSIYAVPLYVDLRGTAYNKRLFREAGLSDAAPDGSWEELLEAVRALSRFEGDELVQVGLWEHWDDEWWGTLQTFALYLFQYNDNLYSVDFRTITFHGERGVETAEFVTQLYQLANPPGAVRVVSDRDGGFLAGQVAMNHGGSWIAQLVADSEDSWIDDLGFFVGRRSEEYEPRAMSFANGIGISSFSTDPDQAWHFITWLMGADISPQFYALGGYISPRIDLVDINMQLQPHLAEWYMGTQYAHIWPEYPPQLDPQFDWGMLSQGLAQVYRGEADARTKLLEVGSAWQGRLNEAWARLESE